MSRRIYHGKNTPRSFRESLAFDTQSPYIVRYKEFTSDDVAPPHYIDALELLVCCGVTGVVTIEGQRYELHGDISAVAVPPGAVHSVQISKGSGHAYVLHISLTELEALIDIGALLKLSGKQLPNIMPVCIQPREIHALVEELIALDDMPFARMRVLFSIFEKLENQIPLTKIPVNTHNRELQNIILWTEENFQSPIQLAEAAIAAGFSRNYFCTWFKTKTGMTYNHYVSHLRVDCACRLLERGGSLEEACFESGFRDMSYFIQLFKRIRGCTPKCYLSKNQL